MLLDELISNGDFHKWTIEFVNEENEKQLLEVWLHKVFDKSFNEFKASLLKNENHVDEIELETTIVDSKSILNKFIPN